MTNSVNYAGQYTVENAKTNTANEKSSGQKGAFAAAIEENPMLNAMGITPDLLLKSAVLVPPLLIADKFVNSKIGGKEENSILKKIANFGDNIYHSLGKKADKLGNFITNNRIAKYFTEDYSAHPRSSLAKTVVMPEINLANELASELKSLQDKPEFAKYFEDGAESLSVKTKDFIKNIDTKNAAKNTDELIKAADELIEKGVVKTSDSLFGSKDLSIMRNKLKAASSKMGETALGSALAKGANEAKGHLTFGGGLFGFAFVSFSLNHAFKEASNAPDGEKISTFMHCISEEFIGFLIMQSAISPFYKLCGNKYRGMTVEARKELENIVTKANTNEKISKEALEIAKIQRDLLLKGASIDDVHSLENKTLQEAKNLAKKLDKNPDIKFWERPLKFFGRILSTGLDEIQKPKYVHLPIFGKTKLPQPTFKGTLGGLGRLAIILGVITPALQKPVTGLCHKIFGEPKAFLAKENAKESNNTDETKSKVEKEKNNSRTETNLLKKWTNLPENSGYNQQNQVMRQVNNITPVDVKNNQNINTPNNIQQPIQQNVLPVPENSINTNKQDDVIASAKLLAKKDTEKKLYVPSIKVDNSYLIERENEINERVNQILKNTNSTVSRLSRTINN